MNPDEAWLDELEAEEAMAGPGRVIPSGPVPDAPTDLSADYLGLRLRTPIVASSSPLTGDLDSIKAIALAGAGAIVLPSLFEEQLRDEAAALDALDGLGGDANPEAISGYTIPLDDYNDGASRYLALIRDAVAATDVPIIGSLNGVTEGGWTRYARLMASSGAAAIELNVYRVAADATVSGRSVEDETLRLIESVATSAQVPIAVKLSPYWSSLAHLAPRLVDAGAAGLVLFNRFYQPDIDLETLRVGPHLVLSSSEELRLPLRWCAILHGRIGDASLAATSGVHTTEDVVKVLLAGANVAMTTSALLRHGPDHVEVLVDGLRNWMQDRGYGSVAELTGAVSQRTVADPAAFERANYLHTLTSYARTFLR